MALQAIIIRADGVIAETTELQRLAVNRVFTDAGLPWRCDQEHLARFPGFTDRRGLISQLMGKKLRAIDTAGDKIALLDAMHRRLNTLWTELLDSGQMQVRAGLREVVCAALREGIALAIVSALPADETHRLIRATLGLEGPQLFKAIAAPGDDVPTRDDGYLYRQALRDLSIDPDDCLAVEATHRGLAAASGADIACVVSKYGGANGEDFSSALCVVDDLPKLISPDPTASGHALGPGDGQEILTVLQQLHAGTFDVFGNSQRSFSMKVSDILKDKGAAVRTVRASDTILTLSQRMRAEKVGALVVTSAAGSLEGIISERDIANGLAVHAAALPELKVADLMTKAVVTCTGDDSVSSVAKVMTQRRFRHMPVEQDGKLVGLISIGDVLAHRLDELQFETRVLRDVLIARG